MRNLLLSWSDLSGDVALSASGTDLATDDSLATAVLVSVFTDRRADDADELPAAEPSFVEWDWLMQYERVRTAWDNITSMDYLFSANAKSELAKILVDNEKLTGGREEFDFINEQSTTLRHGYFQHITIDNQSPVDGLTASMARFALFAVAKGYVEPVLAIEWTYRITVTKIALYVQDNFDFEDNWFWWVLGGQPLGSWDCSELRFVAPDFSGNVDNAKFNDFRARHGQGGDFYVFAPPRPLAEFEEYQYVV
ncbi:MAG: DUF6402 family protein [Desulfovibrionaceae bacterium]